MRKLIALAIAGSLSAPVVMAAEPQNSGIYLGLGYGIVNVPKEDGLKIDNANNANIQFGYGFANGFAIEAQYSSSTKKGSASVTEEDIDVSYDVWLELMDYNPGMTMDEAASIFPAASADFTVGLDLDVETLALYGVYRSSGDLYVKAKAGVVSVKSTGRVGVDHYTLRLLDSAYNTYEYSFGPGDDGYDENLGGIDEKISETNTDFSVGLGVGYKFTPAISAELEFTRLNEDYDYYSLGVNYAF